LDFARLWEQARDLWSRPAGKWLLGTIGFFVIGAAVISFILTRPTYVTLGTFEPDKAPEVAQKLNESKILYRQSGSGYTFLVQQGDLNRAKLVLAELQLDPSATVWTPDLWANRMSWSSTEFDKRRQMLEQMEGNLVRGIEALSAVDQARVTVSLPEEKLLKGQEKPPKATVVVMPKKEQELTTPVVESIMEYVAGSVEGMEPTNVVVMDSSRSRVVSGDAFKPKSATQTAGEEANTQFGILKQYQNHWQDQLLTGLERVVGAGKVSVIVTPDINWDRAVVEATEYKPGPDGKGVVLSEQTKTHSSEGTSTTTTQGPAGTTPNTELGVPSYPGTTTQPGNNISEDQKESVLNYLVSQTKSSTEKPSGAINEIAVGIFVDAAKIDPIAEQAMKTVVAAAMGSKARVEVAAMPFAPSLLEQLDNRPVTGPVATGTPDWLYMVLASALVLGGIAAFFVFFKPRKPVLEPVFAGPEAAMMGGIPVSEYDLASAVESYGAQAAARASTLDEPKGQPESAADLAAMAPDEIALLGDEFLQQLGVDPAKVRMREKVEKIAKASPDAVASLLKTWISEG